MKPTENINIGGYAFTIEQDAYRELEKYLDGVKDSLKDDADEVMQDIEVRIAELLSENTGAGRVVTLANVMEVTGRIGDPEEISEGDENKEQDGSPKVRPLKKQLFRNMDSRILGGVCSGIGAYFGFDPVFVRILFIVLFVAGVFSSTGALILVSLLSYICLWIAMPAARSVEEKCRMNGKPMKLESFVSNASGGIRSEVKDLGTSPAVRKTGRVFVCIFGVLLMVCGLAGLLGCIFIPTVPDIFEKFINLRNFDYGEDIAFASRIVYEPGLWWLVTAMVALLCVWLLYNGTIFCFNFKSPSWKPGLILFLAWVISVLAIAGWIVKLVADMVPEFIL